METRLTHLLAFIFSRGREDNERLSSDVSIMKFVQVFDNGTKKGTSSNTISIDLLSCWLWKVDQDHSPQYLRGRSQPSYPSDHVGKDCSPIFFEQVQTVMSLEAIKS